MRPENVKFIAEDGDEIRTGSLTGSLRKGFSGKGDAVMNVSGSSPEDPGRASTLKFLEVEDVLNYASRRG
ncbi:MAG: hypothetical protein NWF12_04495 [Candidatus Bathyarchaeota archaeon]|nr:hypothetical protein [Candidatus Bathyarchaeota archaeon]